MFAMTTLSQSVLGIYKFFWNQDPKTNPEKSGVYLTRNDRDQTWFRYFDANYGHWYKSWAELQTNAAHQTPRISGAELDSEVVAWARRSRMA
jgi:hypothetical protein